MSTHAAVNGPLSRREREIVDIVYERGAATAAEVREEMTSPPTDAAVRATLRILVEKGMLKFRQEGPRYVYYPTVPREKARKSAIKPVLQTFFHGNTDEAMVALLELNGNDLSQEARERLIAMIEKAESEGG